MRKYQRIERSNVIGRHGSEKIRHFLRKVGKRSATQLTDSERKELDELTRQ